MENNFGQVHVYTGDGHGKTTASLGVALRAVGHGYKVCMIQFLKGNDKTGEFLIQERLKPDFTIHQFGSKSFIIDKKYSDDDIKMAQEGLEFAKIIIKNNQCHILILDEINVAMDFNLIKEKKIINFIKKYRSSGIEIILTGRNASKNIIKIADIVTEMKKVKHYYDSGLPARKGIEY